MKQITKQKTNIVIDLVMLVLMILIAVIGVMIRYVLIPGSERWAKYGENVELSVWGMDRHEWGLIHLIVGAVLMVLLVLHLYLHWKQVLNMLQKLFPQKVVRNAFLVGFSLISIGICLLLFVPAEVGQEIGKGRGRLEHTESPEELVLNQSTEKLSLTKEEQHEAHRTLDIRGSSTLGEIAAAYKIDSKELKKSLHIPAAVSENERLGRIRRNYNFTMSDVEKAVIQLKEI